MLKISCVFILAISLACGRAVTLAQPESEKRSIPLMPDEPTEKEKFPASLFLKPEDFDGRRVEKSKCFSSPRRLFVRSVREKLVSEYDQEVSLDDGRLCALRFLLLESEIRASDIIRSDVKEAAAPSQKVEDSRDLDLSGADELFVFQYPPGSAALAFRYCRLYVHISVLKDTTGNAEQMRDNLARRVLTRAKAAFNPGNEADIEVARRVTKAPNMTYEPFLLKKSEFGDVRDFKQRVALRNVLEGSLPRQRQACVQEALMPNGEQRIVEYLLCESSLEACAVMFHNALTVAEPGRLLVAGPHSKEIQAFGGTDAVDDVYLFRGSNARDRAGMMLRTNRLLVRISIVNDPKNEAQKTRDSLARSVLARANDVFRERSP